MNRSLKISSLLAVAMLFACGEEQEDNKSNTISPAAPAGNYKFVSPDPSAKYYLNDSLVFAIEGTSAAVQAYDSVKIIINGVPSGTLKGNVNKFTWRSQDGKAGLQKITAEVFAGEKTEKLHQNIIFFSDITPVNYTYTVVKKYPHDANAFTQGLIYSEGILYEGTGQKGASELRKVNLNTGEVLQRKTLDNTLFGEGITLFNGHLYQLTWQEGLGLVYDKNTFEEVSKFYYDDEGWGLTNNDQALIMSDGSNRLRFIDPNDFHLIQELRVYDHNGAIGYINELEWIEGSIYANVWQRDLIIIIDPESGKVTGKVDLTGLLPDSQRSGVLNGIAYDKKGKRLFVTGKNWPSLFEITLTEKTVTSS